MHSRTTTVEGIREKGMKLESSFHTLSSDCERMQRLESISSGASPRSLRPLAERCRRGKRIIRQRERSGRRGEQTGTRVTSDSGPNARPRLSIACHLHSHCQPPSDCHHRHAHESAAHKETRRCKSTISDQTVARPNARRLIIGRRGCFCNTNCLSYP